jgi:hypothetical protein
MKKIGDWLELLGVILLPEHTIRQVFHHLRKHQLP